MSNANVAKELRKELNVGVILMKVSIEAIRIEGLFGKIMKNTEN